ICGAEAVKIDLKARQFAAGDAVVREGDVISISGTTGEIALGEVPVITPEPTGHFATVLGFADQFRRLRVRTNADTPEASARAARSWQEANPMLGTRGCRLGIIKPGLYKMQVRALIQAAVERKQAGGDPRVEIMIPLVVSGPELQLLVDWTREAARIVIDETG